MPVKVLHQRCNHCRNPLQRHSQAAMTRLRTSFTKLEWPYSAPAMNGIKMCTTWSHQLRSAGMHVLLALGPAAAAVPLFLALCTHNDGTTNGCSCSLHCTAWLIMVAGCCGQFGASTNCSSLYLNPRRGSRGISEPQVKATSYRIESLRCFVLVHLQTGVVVLHVVQCASLSYATS
jgi:hypothetical protein